MLNKIGSKAGRSGRYVMIITLLLANVTNLLIQIFLPRALVPSEYVSFSVFWASGQLLAAVLFEWLRIGVVRYSEAGRPEDAERLRAALNFCYAFIVSVTLMISVICMAAGSPGQALYWVGFGLLYACSQGAFDYSQARLRAQFRNKAFAASWALRSVLSLALTLGVAYWTGSAASAALALCASFLAWLMTVSVLKWRLPSLDKRSIRFLIRYGIPAALAGILAYALPVAARHLVSSVAGSDQSAGMLLSIDVAQKILMAIGAALNLLLLQPLIRSVDADAESAPAALGDHLIRVIAIVTAAAVCLALAMDELREFVPAAYALGYTLYIWPATIAIALLCVKSFGIDAMFVVTGGTHYSALTSAMSLIIAALGWVSLHVFSALGPLEILVSLVIALLLGAGAGLAFARRKYGIEVRWRDVLCVASASLVAVGVNWALPDELRVRSVPVGALVAGGVYMSFYLVCNLQGCSTLMRGLMNNRVRS
ncbi:hypothetical protein [Stenotrophomonas sp. S41]|uniref:hypothetical protein n=1 Tax=Stenotrophomonas sp. S41 TaxID=2767464 RepID=UPI00190D8F43|nr:hypothetical protein [Stenotrophomonas sp. S41]MBK0012115.1 hypothetical protein [Stenotrophomonas sp. S41]